MPDPCERGLARVDFGKLWAVSAACALGDPAFPEEFIEEGARVEMIARREFFKGAWDASAPACGLAGSWAEI